MEFARDLRKALRQLIAAPGFTLAVILSLAFGIGANAAIFTLLNALLWRPLPYLRRKSGVSPDQLRTSLDVLWPRLLQATVPAAYQTAPLPSRLGYIAEQVR